MRLGVVRSRGDVIEWIFETIFSFLFSFPAFCSLLPQSLKKTWIFIKTLEAVDFNVWKMFDQLDCDKIYEVFWFLEHSLKDLLLSAQDKAVCSARFHGIRGLGTEICRRYGRILCNKIEFKKAIKLHNFGSKHFFSYKFSAKYSHCCRSERLAADLGCAYTYAGVTGVYSQKIFTKLEHTTLKSLNYADFKDENGELYLKDTREHTKIVTCLKKLIDKM